MNGEDATASTTNGSGSAGVARNEPPSDSTSATAPSGGSSNTTARKRPVNAWNVFLSWINANIDIACDTNNTDLSDIGHFARPTNTDTQEED